MEWTVEETQAAINAALKRAATDAAFRELALKDANAAVQKLTGKPLERQGSAICVVDTRSRTLHEVLRRDDIVTGSLQWLGPPANALVARQHLKVSSGNPTSFFWISTSDWTHRVVTVPGFLGYGYRSGTWSPSGQALAFTAMKWTNQHDGNVVLLLWRRGWQHPRLFYRGKRLTVVVWSPDGKQLAVGEDDMHVRFVTVGAGSG